MKCLSITGNSEHDLAPFSINGAMKLFIACHLRCMSLHRPHQIHVKRFMYMIYQRSGPIYISASPTAGWQKQREQYRGKKREESETRSLQERGKSIVICSDWAWGLGGGFCACLVPARSSSSERQGPTRRWLESKWLTWQRCCEHSGYINYGHRHRRKKGIEKARRGE